MNYPDPTNHQYLSFIKSAIRITGYILILVHLPTAVTLLVISEIVGIIEELV